MAISRALQMDFSTEQDKKYRLNISLVRSDVTANQVAAVMDNIITHNVFSSSNGDLNAKVAARFVTTEDLELV